MNGKILNRGGMRMVQTISNKTTEDYEAAMRIWILEGN